MRSAVVEDNRIVRQRIFVILLAASLFSAGLATVFGGSNATAQSPEPAAGEIDCPEPSPSPSPSSPVVVPTIDPLDEEDAETEEDPCEEEDDDDGKTPGGNQGKPGGGKPGDDDTGVPNGDGSPKDKGKSGDRKGAKDNKDKRGKKKADKPKKKKKKKNDAPPAGRRFKATGEFTTDKLQIIAAQLRAEGFTEDQINERVYAPFIIGGPAAWTNTWGAPRYGPGPLVRTHEGQDVFCRYGDPVLATEPGTIEFDDGGLGGKIARLYREDKSYWYYAHLSGFNTQDFENGDRVQTGDVIGYCGNTGNALTTPPHVHFGWYMPNGKSRNPMGMLVKWLRAAETNGDASFKRVVGYSVKFAPQETTSRLFGDSFAPDTSELKISSEALLASSAGGGAFGLAEAALQAALAEQSDGDYPVEVTPTQGAGDAHSDLAELIEGTQTSAPTSDEAD